MDNDFKTYIDAQTEKLAAMIAAGFATTATKEEVGTLQQEVSGLRHEVNGLRTEMNQRFDKVEARLDRIEKSHGYRLETLERDVAVLKT
jgi:hypothetical protein